MAADIIKVDFKAKTRLQDLTLEQQAVEIVNVVLLGPGGIDDLMYESSVGWFAPVPVTPDKDPA